MIGRLLSLLLVLILLPAGEPARAQDGSSVYSVNRSGTGSRGPLQWIFGDRPSRSDPRFIQIEPRRASAPKPRSYEPRRRSSPAPRPAPSGVAPVPGQGDAPPADGSPAPQSADSPAAAPSFAPSAEPAASAPLAVTPSAQAPPQMPPVHIAVIGDSLSIFLAQGLAETYAERPHVTFIRRHREASGLVRDDYYDWAKQLRDLIATTPKLDAVVVQLGSNDRQQLRDAEGVHEPRSDKWRAIYLKRIDEMIAIARDKKIPLIWVGLPAMRGERYSADMLAFNDMFRARAAAGGAAYVDIWEAFTGEDGAYVVNGPDVDGTTVRLRTADGVHFTKAGARKLAFFADKEMKKIVASIEGRITPPAAIAAAASVPASPQPSALPGAIVLPALPEPSLPTALKSNDALLGIPAPDAPLPTGLVARPQQGPVISLHAAPVASGGVLLPAQGPRPAPGEFFRSGLAGETKAGRADDFRSWTR